MKKLEKKEKKISICCSGRISDKELVTLYSKIKEESKKQRRPIAVVLRIILLEYFDDKKQKNLPK
jgi:hypothetical protein